MHTIEQAERFTPGGVHSSLRRIEPRMIVTSAEGAYFFTQEGQRYCDYHAAFGPLVLGHRHPVVERAVRNALDRVDLVGTGVTDLEIDAAERIVRHVPSAEKVVFTNSGSEATYSAIRLARAVTGRKKLIKFQGCYHGWHDAVLMNVITPAGKLGTKDVLTAGATAVVDDTIVCRFNDLSGVASALDCGDVAAIIVEPIQHNIGAVMPAPQFLQGLRDLCTKAGSILIFDEVITGTRHGLGGYQAVAGVTPDLTTLGKAVANGYPAAAVAGPASLMDEFGTGGGPVFFAGTFNGHPAAMAAMIATMDVLETTDTLDLMFARGDRMRRTLEDTARGHGLAATASGFGSVFVLYFMDSMPTCYEDTLENDADRYVTFHRELIERGHFLFPMNLKRSNVSAAHSDADLDHLLEDADAVLKQMAS